MALFINTLAAVAAGTVLATAAFAQSAKEVRGPTPYFAVENEPAPRLIVDPPVPEALAQGVLHRGTVAIEKDISQTLERRLEGRIRYNCIDSSCQRLPATLVQAG